MTTRAEAKKAFQSVRDEHYESQAWSCAKDILSGYFDQPHEDAEVWKEIRELVHELYSGEPCHIFGTGDGEWGVFLPNRTPGSRAVPSATYSPTALRDHLAKSTHRH